MKTEKLPFNNSNLFSNNFLQNRIIKSDEWKQDETTKQIFKEIKDVYKDQKELLTHYNEPQLEDNLIKPIFGILGHFFEVQQKTDKSQRRPDYAFFPDEHTKREAIKNKGKDEFYKCGVAIGDAKEWNRSLDKKTKGEDTFEFQNPSFQIDTYLRETKPKWAILTNGKKWRIYFQETSYKLNSFYEVDIEEIINNDNLEDFKYFYFFFRLEAFTKDQKGEIFLDNVFHESIKYSESIGEDLEENVYKALKWMAEGFLTLPKNNLIRDEKTIKEIHENSLIFLYRLLFVLYANSRGILKPPKDSRYNNYNIDVLIEEIIEKKDKKPISHGALYWTRLEWIFSLINEGSESNGIPKEEFYVPAYNGGLFDPNKHPFLKDKKINDIHIAEVIDLLVRTKSKDHEGYGRIDYSDLSVRHLGGIYEGLLEYKIKIAEEDMVAIKKKGKLIWLLKSNIKDETIYDEVKKGEVYLVTDKGERKATGSYYTPDYIVKYIVENTIGPIVEEKIKNLSNNDKVKEVLLSIKVLDPAMGSGHFLVEATDFLAQKLSLYLEEENGKESDIEWAKREIAKRCIYGVDLNSLAVELAKVSLWLNTISKDKPLSFLDHHLRVGNSLIGTDIKKLGTYPEDKNENNLMRFFGKDFNEKINVLLKLYRSIMERRGENVDDIRKQEELYYELRNNPFRVRFEELANLYTSYYFDNKFSKKEYEGVLSEVKLGGNWKKIEELEIIKKSKKTAEEKKFFHWKLEFLEVFFDFGSGEEKSNPGFDVVIGNPPWGLEFNSEEKEYIKTKYQTITTKEKDSYEVFINLGFTILREDGNFGFIIPNTLLIRQGHEDTRRILLNMTKITNIINLGENVFQKVTMPSCIITFNKSKIPSKINCNDLTQINRVILPEVLLKNGHGKLIDQKFFNNLRNKRFLINISEKEIKLLNRLESIKIKLGDILDYFGEGLKTGDNSIFLSEKKMEIEDEIQKRAIKGCDIERYGILNFRYLLNSNILDKNKHTKAFEYLEKNKNKLNERSLVKKGDIKWYQLNENRVDIVSQAPKLIIRETEDEFISTPETEGLTALKTTFIIIPNKRYNIFFLCGVLNSLLIKKYYLLITNEENRVFARIRASDLESVPIIINKTNEITDTVKKIYELKMAFTKELKSFLRYLSYEIGNDMENFSGIYNIREYWKNDFNSEKGILKILKQNSSRIKTNLSSRKFQESLEIEWNKSVNKLKEIMKEIQDYENILNSLIFKNYSLSEDEVKMVLESFDIKDEIKNDILNKFKELK